MSLREIERASIVALDRAHVWHPYTPMDEYAAEDPIVVTRAKGSYLEDADGSRYLDGNASWWVAALGHGHPRLAQAALRQMETLAHCSLAGITHEPAARLAAELAAVAPPGLSRVFFSDDGSTALEAAIKMAVQAHLQLGAPKKVRFIALEGAFHGDTVGAMSLGGVAVFKRAFGPLLFECVHVDPGESERFERAFEAIGRMLATEAETVAAVVVEPQLQGANGMRIYDASLLRELRALCDAHDVWLIFDEVFTGYGRTGPMWAAEGAKVAPDILCIGKAMTHIVPMAATLANERVFDAFRGDRSRALLHGHTFCGNPVGAAIAREVLAIYRDEKVLERAGPKSARIARAFEAFRDIAGVCRTRSLGMTGAADLEPTAGDRAGYLGSAGWHFYREAKRRGAYLRPLGNTVYVCPPLTIPDADLDALLAIFEESLRATLGRFR